MTNRVGSCTEPIVVTSAGIIRGLEQFPASSGARDSTALAFQHVLASLARIEARLDASERRSASAQPPPRPEPKPPYEDWQRGRGEMGRQRPILSPATFVASQQYLGLVGPSTKIAIQPPRTDPLPWDRYGEGSESFQELRHTAWDNPVHKLDDQPGRLATEWDRNGGGSVGFRGRRHTAWDNPMNRLDDQPGRLATEEDRNDGGSVGFRGRRPTAWDNPALGFDDQPGRLAPKWDNAWGRQEGGRNSDQPRYDHYHVEKPRYEIMRALRFDGSDVGNLDYEESASIYYPDYDCDSEGYDEDDDRPPPQRHEEVSQELRKSPPVAGNTNVLQNIVIDVAADSGVAREKVVSAGIGG
ncbi:hypothetical protein SASPL_141324 [Salvia splendens]|uniref:Uncharacterized protein n=1 Tax=Salvia splendens TaxID=180675 RepID=A0A8X8ZDB5_SALSN|nr:hypothetical protein SASPL_141324 [Salvia splendens]